MNKEIYDHFKCKQCNRVHPTGVKNCSCGLALAVYGIPCNAHGVEKKCEKIIDIQPEQNMRDEKKATPIPPPEPQESEKKAPPVASANPPANTNQTSEKTSKTSVFSFVLGLVLLLLGGALFEEEELLGECLIVLAIVSFIRGFVELKK